MRWMLAAVMLVTAAGCGSLRQRQAPVGDAAAPCYTPCTPSLTDTGVRWQGDPEDPAAWDGLGGSVVPELSRLLLQCERRRQACADFIGVLKRRQVIRAEP